MGNPGFPIHNRWGQYDSFHDQSTSNTVESVGEASANPPTTQEEAPVDTVAEITPQNRRVKRGGCRAGRQVQERKA